MPTIKRGINLKIDSAVQDLCETSNKSSSSTRSVLYLLVVISIIQLIVVFNTFPFSWHNLFMERQKHSLDSTITVLKFQLETKNTSNSDEIKELRNEKQILERYTLENYEILRLPLINVPIHVNDTGLVSGILLCILFLILVFTLEREEINLCIALRAITYRYTDDSDGDEFKGEIKTLLESRNQDEELSEEEKKENEKQNKELLGEINKTRRNYHYNFLTMNEIFTQPNTNIDGVFNEEGNTTGQWKVNILKYKYWLATIIFFLTLANDGWTYEKGFEKYGEGRTIGHYIAMVITLFVMIILTIKCQKTTERILYRYNNFKKKGYEFILQKEN